MIRSGCQGWNYADWITPPGADHVLYPVGTRQSEMLGQYSKAFDTVEVDSTFYAVPSAGTFEKWRERSAPGFLFSLKMPRVITHDLRLGEASFPIAEEFLSRAALLGEKLGPILIQLPPSYHAERENALTLRRFLDFLPSGRNFAVEFREAGWLVEWTFTELERRRIWLCAVEGEWIARRVWFEALDRESDLPVYVRFMGARDLDRFDRVCRPADGLIQEWYYKLRERRHRDAYVYFSNLLEGFAPASANKLKALSGADVIEPQDLEIQHRLFG